MWIEVVANIVGNVARLLLNLSARNKLLESCRFRTGSIINIFLEKGDKEVLLKRGGRGVDVDMRRLIVHRHHRHHLHLRQAEAFVEEIIRLICVVLSQILFACFQRDDRLFDVSQ